MMEDLTIFSITVVLPLGLILSEFLFIRKYLKTKGKKYLLLSFLFLPIALFSAYILALFVLMVFIGTG